MKKSMVIGFRTIKKDIASETGKAARKIYKSTKVFVKDISGEIGVDWKGMYKNVQKGMRLVRRNKNRAFRKLRRTAFYKGASKNVPLYFFQFRKWSLDQISDLQEWASEQYPKVRKFVKINYPKVEKFVLNQFPVYRLIFAKSSVA